MSGGPSSQQGFAGCSSTAPSSLERFLYWQCIGDEQHHVLPHGCPAHAYDQMVWVPFLRRLPLPCCLLAAGAVTSPSSQLTAGS